MVYRPTLTCNPLPAGRGRRHEGDSRPHRVGQEHLQDYRGGCGAGGAGERMRGRRGSDSSGRTAAI
eukprot:364663-Chlamydomonas_euryale.AAC.7